MCTGFGVKNGWKLILDNVRGEPATVICLLRTPDLFTYTPGMASSFISFTSPATQPSLKDAPGLTDGLPRLPRILNSFLRYFTTAEVLGRFHVVVQVPTKPSNQVF